jgi:hypothetical protein
LNARVAVGTFLAARHSAFPIVVFAKSPGAAVHERRRAGASVRFQLLAHRPEACGSQKTST